MQTHRHVLPQAPSPGESQLCILNGRGWVVVASRGARVKGREELGGDKGEERSRAAMMWKVGLGGRLEGGGGVYAPTMTSFRLISPDIV